MEPKTSKYRLSGFINPKNIIGIAVVVAALMITSAIVELEQSKKELKTLMNDEAVSVIKTINQSSLNTVISGNELEDLVALRLLGTARMVRRLDSMKLITQTLLHNIADENSVFRINIFDTNADKVFSSITDDTLHLEHNRNSPPGDYIKSLLAENKDESIIGFKKSRHDTGKRFAVAVKRSANPGGMIVVNIDADYMIQFKKKIGLNKLIEDIGQVKGMGYIILQDSGGVIASSKPDFTFEPARNDDFLNNALTSDSIYSRVFSINGTDYYEAARTLKVNGESYGLLRIGLDMDEMRSLETRMVNRGIITTVILIVIGVIVISVLNMNQNLKFVSGEFSKIQSFSGNILQNMADSVISTGMNGEIRIFNKNAEKLFSMSSAEVIGSDLCRVFDSRLEIVKQSLNDRKELNNKEIEFSIPGIATKTLSLTSTFTKDTRGNYDSFTVVIKNLTGIRKMEETVKQKEKLSAMGELASGVAHEVRNPLNSINMIAQRIGKEFITDENKNDLQPLVKVMLSESKRVNSIIEEFLKFARPPKLNLGKVRSGELLAELKNIGETTCSSKAIEFRIIETGQAEFNADKELLKQALVNLLINAVDATPKSGSVTIESFTHDSNFCFKLKDTGSGIGKDELKKIFDLYYTTKPNGSGLGLSIVQQIVSQHNGSIDIESSPGIGSSFTICLPIKI
ncbi:MAG: PAS domain-containing protein [Ignavibacteria bacterium]|nr:PAS domain-containing protein [Ignavibacteria bacterium]